LKKYAIFILTTWQALKAQSLVAASPARQVTFQSGRVKGQCGGLDIRLGADG
jgi:hypothetical protein